SMMSSEASWIGFFMYPTLSSRSCADAGPMPATNIRRAAHAMNSRKTLRARCAIRVLPHPSGLRTCTGRRRDTITRARRCQDRLVSRRSAEVAGDAVPQELERGHHQEPVAGAIELIRIEPLVQPPPGPHPEHHHRKAGRDHEPEVAARAGQEQPRTGLEPVCEGEEQA